MGSKRARRRKRRKIKYDENYNINQASHKKSKPKPKKQNSPPPLSWPWIIAGVLSLILFGVVTSMTLFNPFQSNKETAEAVEQTSETEQETVEEVSAAPETVDYSDVLTLSNTLPHNSNSWIEGLFFSNGELYESQGREGESAVSKNIDLTNNQAASRYDLPSDLYAEGSVILDGKLYVLTYQDNKVLILDPNTMQLLETRDYKNREGWGLTTDGENLIASDGSSHLYYMDPELNDVKTITVMDNGNEVSDVNELEYINGEIWANVWHSDQVLVIDPETGNVKQKIDFSGIRSGVGEVLNGIAYNPDTNKVYLTGKLWDKMYEFDFKQ